MLRSVALCLLLFAPCLSAQTRAQIDHAIRAHEARMDAQRLEQRKRNLALFGADPSRAILSVEFIGVAEKELVAIAAMKAGHEEVLGTAEAGQAGSRTLAAAHSVGETLVALTLGSYSLGHQTALLDQSFDVPLPPVAPVLRAGDGGCLHAIRSALAQAKAGADVPACDLIPPSPQRKK